MHERQGVQMALLVRDSQVPNVYATEGGAAIAAAGRLVTHKVGGVIGDLRSDLTRYEALMTSSVKVPHCSTIPTTIASLDAILDVIEYFGWHRISILQPYDPQFKVALDKVKSVDSRIQILMASGNLQKDVLYAARDAGMMAAEYAWITINDISDVFQNATARRDFDGTIMVDNAWDLSGYAPYDDFRDEWMRLNTTEYPGAGDPILHNNEAMAYSCAMMLAHGYGQYMRKKGMLPGGQINEAVRSAIIQGDLTKEIHMNDYFSKTPYMSPSGPITLDVNGDRENGHYVAMSLQDGYASTFGVIATSNSSKYTKPFFKDGSTIPPRDAPPWAIQNPTWNNTGGIIFGIICILLIAMVLVNMCVVIRFRHHIVIKASSPTFCICELLGILFVAIWCLLYVGIPNEASCIAQMFLVPVGATLLVGSLTVKNYRIYRIFNNSSHTSCHLGQAHPYNAKYTAVPVDSMPIRDENPMLPPPGTPPPSPFIANADQAEEQSNDQKEQQSLPSLPPPLQQEQRRSQSSEDAKENVFRARVARRPNMIAAVSGGVTIKEEEEPRGRTERELFLIRMQSCSHNDPNVAQESADSIMQGSDGNHGEPIANETALGRESGAHRMLESFVFLLPIMSQRSRLSNFLSHWAMATIILIPEAHAFLVIDSTTGKSRSVLMKSMVPIYDEREPTLRVEMVRSGLLLLRFPSVARLKGWLGLFTQQDLHMLCATKEHEETQWSSPNPVPYESDATVSAGGGGSLSSRSMGTGRPISMATSGFPSQERHSLDALHGGRDGLTKVEADTLEDQMAGFNFQPVGRESTSPRSTSFASRLGSSISSGASRLWSTRKNSAGSFWGSWSSRRTNSHDTTNTIAHRTTELLSDKGIGPLDPHGTPSCMLSGESSMYGNNNKDAAKAGAHSPPNRPAASTSAPSQRLSELHCASKTVKLSSPPVDVCSVDVNLQKASHKGKETASYSDQADRVAETSREPVLRCAQGTDTATKCHQSSSALTENSPSIPTTLASSAIVPSPASPGTTGEAMHTDVSTHSTLVSPTPARTVTPFLGCGSGGVTPDMSNVSTSSTAPPSRIPSPLAAVLDGRPHLVEVLSAMGIAGDMDDYGHSDDDLYDPEFDGGAVLNILEVSAAAEALATTVTCVTQFHLLPFRQEEEEEDENEEVRVDNRHAVR
ncbi:hypothetical protein BGW42_000381 [Actinomortierella wolfii]|nr:hypothetical protein BGW42_000381 [Actinomortierella wolfii]